MTSSSKKIKQFTKYAEYKEIYKSNKSSEYTFNIDDLQINIYLFEIEIFLKNIEFHKKIQSSLYAIYCELSEYLETLYNYYDFSYLFDFSKNIYTIEKQGEKYSVTNVEYIRKLREEEWLVSAIKEDFLMITDDLITIFVDNEDMYHQVKELEKDPNIKSFTLKKIDKNWKVEKR